jgi:hypothetical protein
MSLIAKRGVIALIAAIALVYVGDYLIVRWKMAHPATAPAFGTIQMYRLLAIPMKDGKTDYELDANQPVILTPCVHALFPHMGNSPCWYLQRNSQQPIPM